MESETQKVRRLLAELDAWHGSDQPAEHAGKVADSLGELGDIPTECASG